MAIEYVEIRSGETRELIGIVDTAQSIIWHRVYYGVGDFEIYAPCVAEYVALLQTGNLVTRHDDVEVGLIESVQVTVNEQDGRMIVAKGRFAKSILNRRIIYRRSGYSVSPTILSGRVENAARVLVLQNAISCPFDSGRNMPGLVLGEDMAYSEIITDETGAAAQKQVTYDNLLDYTDSLLKEYGMGAYCGLNASLNLAYNVFAGTDRSMGNASGNQPVIFSQDFDNLISSEYFYDLSALKNTALIGGAGEGTARFCSILKSASVTGMERREIFVDAAAHSKTYTDDDGVEQPLTDAEYDSQLKTLGQQNVAERSLIETFDGAFDMTSCSFVYGRDFDLGDIVTVQDVDIGLYISPRILEILESQDNDGYTISAVYGK